jgi:hypothetical protein
LEFSVLSIPLSVKKDSKRNETEHESNFAATKEATKINQQELPVPNTVY